MKKVTAIGYGNTLRGDDAAGIRVAELIAKHYPEIECICVHQLMPDLAEQISESDIVLFIDADVEITQSEARLIEPGLESDQPRTHFISPESLLGLSLKLYQKIPVKTYVIGIPASRFDFSEELSESTARAVEESLKLVDSIIHDDPDG